MTNFLCITMLFKTVIKVISPLLSGVQLHMKASTGNVFTV